MQELEKILEEIKDALKEIYLDIANNYDISDLSFDDSKVACVASKFRCTADDKVEKIIHKHIFSKDTDITNKCGDCSRRKWYQKGYDDGKKNDGWIPVEECLPEDGTDVLVVLKPTYESDYIEYSIARYLRFENDEAHWCDNHYGYLEWEKYSDGHGGSSWYRVVAWQKLDSYHPERSDNHDGE